MKKDTVFYCIFDECRNCHNYYYGGILSKFLATIDLKRLERKYPLVYFEMFSISLSELLEFYYRNVVCPYFDNLDDETFLELYKDGLIDIIWEY